MPRKLKTYQTSQGFYDLAVAVPSMKAALQAWGSEMNLFHKGFAFESDDPRVIAATMERPGVVLQRPVGSTKPFQKHAELPDDLPATAPARSRPSKTPNAKARKRPAGKASEKAAKKAALAYAKKERKRATQRRRQEALQAKRRKKRDRETQKAEGALHKAQHEHDAIVDQIDKDREAIEMRAAAEEKRWSKLKDRLDETVRKANR
jgi:hypothetical protein